MLQNGVGLKINDHEEWSEEYWLLKKTSERTYRNGKRFIQCICPKCTIHHNVYMLWSGRGRPRKYCANCRPLVSGYDDAAIYEATISTPGHPKKRSPRLGSD